MSPDDLLRRQAGVITRAQALRSGVSRTTLTRWVGSGRWVRMLPCVYRSVDAAETPTAWVHAAVLWAGAGAVLSGPAAAWWHGLLVHPPRGPVEVTVARARRPRAVAGVRVRRRDLDPADIATLRGVAVTGVPLTVLEAAVTLDDGAALLDRALQRRLSFGALVAAQHRNLGRHGSPAAGALLAVAADHAASAAERRLVALLRDGGVDGWVLGHPALGFVLDLAFPAAMVAVEVDGWAWHSGVQEFRADRRRQNALVLAGWTVLRFSWHDLMRRPVPWSRRSVPPSDGDHRLWTWTARIRALLVHGRRSSPQSSPTENVASVSARE